MSGGSKSSTQQQQQQAVSSNTLDPEFKSMLMGNVGAAQTRAASMLPYTGQLTAGFTPTQIAAQNTATGIANDGSYGANNNAATSAISGVMNSRVNPTINAPTITAGQLSTTDMSKYMNPFTSGVIDTTIADQERARQIQGANDARQASAQGAFGGSRSGVSSALTNEAYDRNTASLLAGLHQADFTQAQGAASTDIANKMAADTANAGNSMTAQQGTFNNSITGNNQTMTAAGNLQTANNNGLQTATQQASLLSGVGDAQQAQQQQALDAAYQAWQSGQQLTLEQQQMINQAMGLVPSQQTITSSGSSNGSATEKTNGGLTGLMSGLGSLGMGLGAMGVAI